ncbi:MAG: DUF998 domain-containing protein [Magnetococcus sp. YQC-5]
MFVVVVLSLHVVQKNYDPINQLMSELVFGPYGSMMIFAFIGLAFAVFGMAIELMYCSAGLGLRVLLWAVSVCFLLAGLFPLGKNIEVHIASVALAFIFMILAIYLFPVAAGQASRLAPKSLSWTLAVCVAVCVALGNQMIPMGVGQRLAAFFLLLWLTIVSWRLWRGGEGARDGDVRCNL